MKILLNIILVTVFFLSSNITFSQNETFRSKSSFGPMVGGSYYIGDLNPYDHFKNTHLSGGLVYRYAINPRVALRSNLMYAALSADDANSEIEKHQLRNLSFETDIFELAAGIEFNYFNYKMRDTKYFFSPYMFIEIGIFSMNPKTEYNGEMIELQPLGTEGQSSSLSNEEPYSLTQIVIPMGIGFKINLGKKAAISFEYGIRKTFTDYIDDVGGDYVNTSLLAEENGNIAARLSDPSFDGFEAVGSRGNNATNDWYSMFGVMLTFPLGKESKCFYR